MKFVMQTSLVLSVCHSIFKISILTLEPRKMAKNSSYSKASEIQNQQKGMLRTACIDATQILDLKINNCMFIKSKGFYS
jgi:hypothetical protein